MKTLLKASLVATAIASIPSGAYAFGAGPINVLTGLGQPLRAEVALTATPQELQALTARIASPEAFRQANIQYSAALSLLRVSVDVSGARPVLRISSDRPVNEPFLDLLLEFNWVDGSLVREYTFLLDPIDLTPPPPVVPRPAAAAVPASQTQAVPAIAAQETPDSYRVQRGDTLYRIAGAHRPEGVSLDQALIALQRANPGAFDGGNINRLRAGSILRIPAAEEVRALNTREARREVLAHAADFDAYRQQLAGAAAAVPAAAPTAQESAGKITPRVAEPPPVAPGTDHVQVSRAPDASAQGTDQALLERLRALEEDQIARENEINEARARQAELERSIRDLQQLLELKNEQFAELQRQLGTDPAAQPAAATPDAPAPQETAETLAEPAPAESEPATAAPEPALAPESAPAATPVQPVETPAAPKKPPAAAKKPPVPRRPAPEPPPPSFLDELLGNPLILAAGGGVLALLLGYAGYKVRQRRQENAAPDGHSMLLSAIPAGPNSVFGATGGQSVDTSSSSVLQTDFSQSGLSSIDTDEGVDPVAEADVYMAYGRDAQAEEILVDALKADPSRQAIYLKLLEVYAARKSLQQFETTAAELYARTEGNGPEWAKAAAMGGEIDPANPLYASGGNEPANGPRTQNALKPAGTAAPGAAAVAKSVPEPVPAPAAPEPVPAPAAPEPVSASVAPKPVSMPAAPEAPSAPPAAADAAQLKDTWAMPGGLSPFAQDDETPAEVTPEAEAPATESPVGKDAVGVDTNVLDFDLGFDLNEQAGAEAAEAPVDEFSLDFDLPAAAPPAKKAPEVTAAAAVPFDPVSTMVESSGTFIGGQADERRLDLESGEATLFDLADTVIESSGAFGLESTEEDVVDLEKSSFDNNLLDFDLEIDAPPQTPESEPSALNLSGIDLNLEPPTVKKAPAPAAPAVENGAFPTQDDLPGQEVDTKLELARAYEEMGDKEGARELLEEVLREGNEAQQGAARDLLTRLD